MLRVGCPGCGAVLPLTDAQLGRRIECGRCGRVFVVDRHGDLPPARRSGYRDDDSGDDGYYDPDDLPPARRASAAGSLATAGLVLGIVGVTLAVTGIVFCCPYVGGVFGVLGIVFGMLGRRSENRGMAVGGISTGAAAVVISVAWGVAFLAFLAAR